MERKYRYNQLIGKYKENKYNYKNKKTVIKENTYIYIYIKQSINNQRIIYLISLFIKLLDPLLKKGKFSINMRIYKKKR